MENIGIGIVGLGFMGFTHFQAARGLAGAHIAAIATSDPRKARGDFRGVRGNFGSGGGQVDLKGIAVHATLESLLDDPSVDLVDLCLPSHLHTTATLKALRAGKHVLVEKPVALKPAEAQKMIAAARKARRLLLVGQVLKFFPEFKLLEEARDDGRWGKLVALHLRRRISRPDWGTGSWFGDLKKSGGMVVDLHIHDTDLVGYLFGKPRSVLSSALIRERRVDFLRTTYNLRGRNAPYVTAEAGWINAPGLAFTHGYDAYFERGTVSFESCRGAEPVLYTSAGGEALKLAPVDGFQAELEEAVAAVRNGRLSPRLSPETAKSALEVCIAEEKSARTGKMVSL